MPFSLLSPARRPTVPSVQRLHVAVAALFVLDGVVFGSWAARVPSVAQQVGASHSALGGALLALSVGALASMQATGRLAARFGSGPVSAAAGLAVSATVVLPGVATSVPLLCASLLVFGAATGAVNVAANSLGVEVEARAGRPLLSGLHAGFSLGGLAGALLGGAAAAVLGAGAHLSLVAAGGLVLMAWLLPVLLAAPRPSRSAARAADGPSARPRRVTAALVVLGVIAGCTAFGEGALTDWGALLLQQEVGATATLGALGYACFASAMAAGRLAGGRLLVALGERRLVAGGSVLAAAGSVVVVTASSLPAALAGFTVVGLGLANVFPLAIARAGLIGGASGIALATTVGYTGLLGGPPAIGLLAEHVGLPWALSSVVVLAVLAAVLVCTVTGDSVRLPARPTLARVGARLQPVVSGFGHGTGVYVRDLGLLRVDGA